MGMVQRWLAPTTLLVLALLRASSADTLPAPLIIPPSQYFEGNDGPWSTFDLRVGTPGQLVRVLISTASPDTWVVADTACQTTACQSSRGEVFDSSKSSTFLDRGYFGLHVEGNLNYTGIGNYGLETLGLGLTAAEGPTLQGQVVATINTTQFYLGIFGLNIQPTNFTLFNNTVESFFSSLKTQKYIPSLSWSYTAGNQYRLKSVFGNFVIGGYDASRFTPNGLTFDFAPDSERDLVVGLQSLKYTDSTGLSKELLSGGILTFIDSTIPYIVLPLSACQEFENVLGIQWNDTAELYTISDSVHNSLTSSNPNFTFILGNGENGGNTIPIVLPYAAFDLTASAPLVSGSSRYFPLKRASNDTQFTLGRTFLQEAYLTADYERQNFSVSQCVFVENDKPDVKAIFPLGYVNPDAGNSSSGGNSTAPATAPSSISTGAVAGIVVAAVALLAGITFLSFAYKTRRWLFDKRAPNGASELDGEAIGHEADGRAVPGKSYPMGNVYEADSKLEYDKVELAAAAVGYNLHGELPGSIGVRTRLHSELQGSTAASEVEGSGVLMELAGSPVPIEYYGPRSKGTAPHPAGSSRTTSLRDEAIRHIGKLGKPASPPSSLAQQQRKPSTPGSPISDSEEAGASSWLMSPVSADSESGEPSRVRGRPSRQLREPNRDVSPAALGDHVDFDFGDHGSVISRDPSVGNPGSRSGSSGTGLF